ncbi:hypothetical protein [Streptacidiphilus sp. PB12-B1b]|uniref:hypothetical protein n=1 Tax=Streptacidiphilus sp. PB12-B1b TaxID=2705012 RepID=UPI001CDC70A6|nr:hypothetical protein [Streptacidiphilus sp. PB12-B1b]
MTTPEAVEPTTVEAAVVGGEAGAAGEGHPLPELPLESDRREGTPRPADISTHP